MELFICRLTVRIITGRSISRALNISEFPPDYAPLNLDGKHRIVNRKLDIHTVNQTPIFETTSKDEIPYFAEVRECQVTGSKSVHTNVGLSENQVLARFSSRSILLKPNYLTVQINSSQHILLKPEWLQYINHGCDPNVFFDVDRRKLVALRNIYEGEELRFFYPSTEWSMDNSFDCNCASDACLKQIQGAAFLSIDVLRTYRLSPYISQQISVDT